uniref:ATP synthase complex subunit 8 n=1 Tax=Thienemanniella nipponica TaxID=2970800 RepID=A0A976UF55_9DIPT|nr:ATP synthase F0 subunit 8 [Thienemanniella nipponica]UVG40819.1 ATP synthase F0 subunit 8 [Thienemanniella nipponica]
MPQMAPISWLILFFLFTLSFFLFNIMNYFNKLFLNINNNKENLNFKNNTKNFYKKINWKW